MVASKSRSTASLHARIEELEDQLAKAERTTTALRDVGLALGSTLDLDQLLELILTKITELLDADRATLYLLDEQRQRLLSRIIIGDEAKSIELPVGQGIAGQVAKTGKAIRIKDAYKDRRFARTWDDVSGYRTRSILAAPMKNHVGRTIGVIQILNKRGKAGPAEFSSHDEELLSALATQAAVSIDNSRLFLSVIQKNMQLVETKEQLEHRVADLKLLFELESAMGRAGTIEDLARAVVGEAARACGAQAGGLLIDELEGGVWLYFIDTTAPHSELEPVEVKRVSAKRGEGIVGTAMVRDEAVSIPNPTYPTGEEGPVSARLSQVLDLEVSSAVAVPLEGEEDEPIGALVLYNASNPNGFTQDARALLRLVSANASTALQLFRSRHERERSERLTSIGRLLSGVMHDIRTPLTVISGYVQLMATTADSKTRHEYASHVLKQFDAISAMQREVLEFARGEKSVLLRKVYLARYFAEVQRQIVQELEGTQVELVLDIEQHGVARFDEKKITRVVHNLVRNAIDAMGQQGGTLTVAAHREGDELVLVFSDTGRGIPKDIQGRLFQSFVTSGKRSGTGLGLAIVKKIVDEHSGIIGVETSKKGTTFTIRLPQETPGQPASERRPGVAARAAGRKSSGAAPKRAKPRAQGVKKKPRTVASPKA